MIGCRDLFFFVPALLLSILTPLSLPSSSVSLSHLSHQVFAVRQVCEKYLANGKNLFSAFMDLEKAYDTIDRLGMWQMLRVYGVGGKLLKAVQSFYVDSSACERVGNDVSEWFPVNVGSRQGCVMSPWLFNVYMDGVVREVNVRMLGAAECE